MIQSDAQILIEAIDKTAYPSLTQWEKGFLSDMRRVAIKLRKGLTPKQSQALQAIYRKVASAY